MGIKPRRGKSERELQAMFATEVLGALRARAKGPRHPSDARLQAMEAYVHGPLPEPLRSFLALDDELVLDHSTSGGIGPWDLLESTDRMAPRPEAGNLFEQVVLADQEQFACNIGLLQIATSAIPVGIKDASDLYFVGVDDEGCPVSWFVPEDDGEVVGVIADSLETFGAMALLAQRAADGDSPAAIRADAEAIRNRCEPRWLSSELSDVLGENWPEPKLQCSMESRYDRSLPWLYALSPYLRSVGEDDDGVQYTLSERWETVAHLDAAWRDVFARARPADHLHDAFYWLWRSYFLDERELAEVEHQCLDSERPLIADMARLVGELRAGRRTIGMVDVVQVRSWLRRIAGT